MPNKLHGVISQDTMS